MPGIHCIPPWKRGPAPARGIPTVVLYLINRHATEWAYAHCGTVRFLYKPTIGYWVLLRTPVLREKWLATGLLVRGDPRADSGWKNIRTALKGRSFPAPAQSQHRYLFVKKDSLKRARDAAHGLDVTVLDVDQIHICDQGRAR